MLLEICVLLLLQQGVYSDAEGLQMTLLSDYDATVFPANPEGHPVNLTHGLHLHRILKYDDQVLVIDGIVQMSWIDNRLKWNTQDYYTNMLHIQGARVWKPDIVIMNSADEIDSRLSDGFNAIVTDEGSVSYYIPMKIRSFCSMGDDGCCDIDFLSWTYDGLHLDLQLLSDEAELSSFDDSFNKQWTLRSAKAKRTEIYYPCCPEPYITITYTLCMDSKQPPNGVEEI